MYKTINQFKRGLKKPSGRVGQLKMAPELRKNELLSYDNGNIKSKSAVLVLLYLVDNELNMVLTERSSNLRKHSGQISFPGGKHDDSDKDLIETAFREAKEEIGLENINIEVLGSLSPIIIPVTNFEVYPFVVFSNNKPIFTINKDEVESLIEVPINILTNLKNIKRTRFDNSTSGKFLEAPYFDVLGYKVWGATAMMISELLLTLFPDSDYSRHEMSFY